jgi:predicted kinase
MLVGLPGSGKSTYAKNLTKWFVWLSSDAIRKELYGDESIQGDNDKVFKILHQRLHQALLEGKNVIYDATNISRKKRMSILSQEPLLKNYFKEAIVFATSIEICIERQRTRERKVPFDVIMRMARSFNYPLKSEGFDSVTRISFTNTNVLRNLLLNYTTHDNPHHKANVNTHVALVSDYCYRYIDETLLKAAQLHDIGKQYCKTMKDGIAHFYGHANIGAYQVASILSDNDSDDIITLVEFHMNPFNWEQSEKAKLKDLKLLGPGLYRKLVQLHIADNKAEDYYLKEE